MSPSKDALPSRPKRPASESVESLNVELKTKRSRIHFARSELKAKVSFDSEWWHKAAAYCMELKEHEDLFFRKELLSFMKSGEGDETDFELTQTAEDSYATMKSYEVDYRLCLKQAKRLDTSDDVAKSKRRSFMNLFTGSKLGLGIVRSQKDEEELGFGRRNTKEQSKFRDTLIQTYELRKPGNKHEKQVWNIILGGYEPMANFTASHLFAVMAGQDIMTAVFGPEAKKELFSPRNALLLPNPIEEMFDSGLFAIVPAVTDDMSKAEVSLWEHTHPQEYKLRIIDYRNKIVDQEVMSGKTWRDLDNMKLSFPNDFRPRARYLYFNYCFQLLKLAWKKGRQLKALPVLESEVGKPFWGTKGKYLPAHQLQVFVEELGHEAECLLDGKDETFDDVGDKNVLLAALAGQMRARSMSEEESDEESEEESDD
jgi:hypothetical protein